MNLTKDALSHLEKNSVGESLAVPVKFNKDGSLSATSKAVPGDEFVTMMEHARRKVRDAHENILKGSTDAIPYRKGQETACDYCAYRHVCGFDIKVPGYRYRDIHKMSREEVIAAMKKES